MRVQYDFSIFLFRYPWNREPIKMLKIAAFSVEKVLMVIHKNAYVFKVNWNAIHACEIDRYRKGQFRVKYNYRI